MDCFVASAPRNDDQKVARDAAPKIRHTREGGYPVRRELSIPLLASRNTGSSAFADDDERGRLATASARVLQIHSAHKRATVLEVDRCTAVLKAGAQARPRLRLILPMG
jgi:hypothetical protein